MDKQISKLRKLIQKYLYLKKENLEKDFGKPSKKSEEGICFFNTYRWLILRDEMVFIFEDDIIIDIILTEYILGIEYSNTFYFEDNTPTFKVQKFI